MHEQSKWNSVPGMHNDFASYLEKEMNTLELREEEQDNNSYEAPTNLMIIQGKRRTLEVLYHRMNIQYGRFLFDQVEEDLISTINELQNELAKRRENKKPNTPKSLVHARLFGEYDQAQIVLNELRQTPGYDRGLD